MKVVRILYVILVARVKSAFRIQDFRLRLLAKSRPKCQNAPLTITIKLNFNKGGEFLMQLRIYFSVRFGIDFFIAITSNALTRVLRFALTLARCVLPMLSFGH